MRALLRPVSVCLFFLVLYYILAIGGVVPASDGINQRQVNQIKAERYIYSDRQPNIVLAGSSMTAELLEKYFGSTEVTNIALSGESSQTGLKLVALNNKKPEVLLVELNYTLTLETDAELIGAIQHPVLNFIKSNLPIFREEYQPVSVLVHALKNRSGGNADSASAQIPSEELREKLIAKVIERSQDNLSPETKQQIVEQAELIKQQLIDIQNQGVRVILFNVPGEASVAKTPERQQETALIRSLFPTDTFEWLPEPVAGDWTTYDGVHLIRPDAKKFAKFIEERAMDSHFSKTRGK